jgi:hypothetical protein
MRSFLHKLLVTCGVILVLLRFIPAPEGSTLAKIYFNQSVHNRLVEWGETAVSSVGLGGEQFKTQLSGLMSLMKAVALIIEAGGIALTFVIITRFI